MSTGALFQQGEDLASRAGLEAEDEFVSWAEAHREDCGVLGHADVVELKKASLDEGQSDAVATLLASRSRVTVFQGDAGTGKTHSLKAVVAAIERRGGRIFGCAPSAGAADVLRKELTSDANTLQQLLANPQLQAAMRGRVIIVDEAGLMSVRQMRDLCRLADANDYRLLLVGDTKQHGSVEAGDALWAIQKFTTVPVARLTNIRRQKDPEFREAVADLAAGEVGSAVARFRKLEAVRELPSERQLYVTADDDYINTLRAGKTCLVISPVWAEIHAFTLEVRRQMRTGGLLSGEDRTRQIAQSLDWTQEWCRQIENYKTGDLLWFHRNEGDFDAGEYATVSGIDGACLVVTRHDGSQAWINPRQIRGYDVQIAGEIPVAAGDTLLVEANEKSAGLKNGDRVEVAGFGNDDAILLRDGRRIPPSFRQFTLGYASTSHGSQGKTVNRGILIMADEGIATANLKQAYVSNSRFQETQMIYTTDIEAAREAMGRLGDRLLASELVSPKILKPDKPRSPASPGKGLLSGMHHGIRASARALLQTFADPTEKTGSGQWVGHN